MKLSIAEQFFSIQGEGRYSGTPAHFLRLAGCNLMCGGYGTETDKQLHDGATWRCDTIEVWRKGAGHSVLDLMENWAVDGTLRRFHTGAHLVITGGEPLLQQQVLAVLIEQLDLQLKDPFIEIETNGTLASHLKSHLILSYNVSPKLKNSGMPDEKTRINLASDLADFKFVVSQDTDIGEILAIIDQHKIPRGRVYLMPATEDRSTLINTSELVANLCIDYGFNFSSRHQVMIWDRTTGV